LCIGNRRLHSHEILSEIGANDDRHHNTILYEPSNDVHAVGRSIEMPWLVDRVYNGGSLIETKPQSKLNPSSACLSLFANDCNKLPQRLSRGLLTNTALLGV
jgi:hypothetical protein